ncbi:hypothetical protein HRR83_000686 [Exophiala dermatitidis]|uniref:Uncharacterized protein n=1 Tax=Exophiala dermatitidis TaxID=5970 RepID=A0AAN6F1V0_EXODE|nr:hypothetical protein HRR75_000626 [Exophiala dermatitidis]KAJ4527934.1 hypothetical protein HRR74_000689 [Exophiala dermatitidis]KAJ4528568.1 hypothetical protein HRR73_001191 [Exophiala dermatitidis]KAJ4529940.1 hypothetical protein HRR76_009187 [Exophiala dermatitidis]KAJ4552922.1 hypothetical protein HRR78_003181 [Exophiala dermatitidis]
MSAQAANPDQPADRHEEQQAITDLDRGLLDDNGNVVHPCSSAYLTTLVLEFLRAKAYPLVKMCRDHDWTAQIRRVQFLEVELTRLLENPDLFASQAARAKFTAIIALDANLQFIQAVKDLLVRESLNDITRFSRTHFTHRPYRNGTKGWENFLLNMAPGAPGFLDRKISGPPSAYQLLPPVGARIVNDWKREEQQLARWIMETPTPVDVLQAETTKRINPDLQDDDEANAEAVPTSQATEFIATRPNLFTVREKINLDVPTQEPEQLEDYGIFISRLELPPLPPNFPFATLAPTGVLPLHGVRTWHPPTPASGLQFRSIRDVFTKRTEPKSR